MNQALGATTANGRFTSNQVPAVTHPMRDRAIGRPLAQALQDQRKGQQHRIELGRGAQAQGHAGGRRHDGGRTRSIATVANITASRSQFIVP